MTSTFRLIIHYNSCQIIQSFTPDSDTSIVDLFGLVDISSITVVTNGEMIPFIYKPDKKVQISDIVSITKGLETITGEVLDINSDFVTIVNAEEVIQIRHPDRISLMQSDNEITHQMIMIDGRYTDKIHVSYICSSINWTPKCSIISGKGTIKLIISGIIDNSSHKNIEADTSLVSRGNKEYIQPSSISMKKSIISSNTNLDNVIFPIGKRVIYDKQFVQLSTYTVDYIKVYVNDVDTKIVNVGYTFTSPGFIPNCDVNVYDATMTYIGNSQLKEYRKDDEIIVYMGETSLVKCKNIITYSDTIEDDYVVNTKSVITTITNNTGKKIKFILKYFVGEDEYLFTNDVYSHAVMNEHVIIKMELFDSVTITSTIKTRQVKQVLVK